jgi:hypothetical protein
MTPMIARRKLLERIQIMVEAIIAFVPRRLEMMEIRLWS